jgi:hypothetical protein
MSVVYSCSVQGDCRFIVFVVIAHLAFVVWLWVLVMSSHWVLCYLDLIEMALVIGDQAIMNSVLHS